MTTLIARFARLGYTLTPCPDGYELAIEPPAVFGSASAALAWLERREAEQARRVGDGKEPQMKALDLFCKAGGATKGLQRARYHVTGVDIEPQPRYCGDVFHQDDAFAWLRGEREPLSSFDLIWASPKCQGHSVLTPTSHKAGHEIQLPSVLAILRAQPTPYIVENVEGTQQYMRNPAMLCGSMLGLRVWRHRWFELGNTSVFFLTPPCNHSEAPVVISGSPRRNGCRKEPNTEERRAALETPWMRRTDMDEAIPPAYSEFLAQHILEAA